MLDWGSAIDWDTKMGVGGVVVWIWKTFFEDNAKRGQRLVDDARPELRAEGNFGARPPWSCVYETLARTWRGT